MGEGTIWYPAVAAGPNGQFACVYDVYHNGDYDIGMMTSRTAGKDARGQDAENTTPNQWIAQSTKFEARPSAAYDPQGRLLPASDVQRQGKPRLARGGLEPSRQAPSLKS